MNTLLSFPDEISLPRIAESGQCFRWTAAGEAFVIIHRGRRVRAEQAGPRSLRLDCAPEEAESLWRPYFDADTDYAAICRRVPREDAYLREAMEDQAGVRILRQDFWEMLITFILSQNRSIPLIRASVEALCRAAGTPVDRGGDVFYAFPGPEQLAALPEDALDACRLGYRKPYVRAAAACAPDPEALSRLPDAACEEALRRLPGVGPKVAACVMLFGLHRLNAFPVDVWIRRVLERHYPGGYPAEAYAPYNGVFQQYLFAHGRNDG